MKQIVFTVTNDLNNDRRMHRICGSLYNAGYAVTLVGRNLKKSKPIHFRGFEQLRLSCFFNQGKLFYIEYNLRLFLYLLFKKTDIICAIDLDTIAACTIAGKIRGKKLVYDAHEYFTEVPEVMHRPMVRNIWKWVEKTFVPKMDTCYTVSQSLAELFEQKYGKKFFLIMNAPPLKQDGEEQKQDQDKFILYQGALNKGRGLEILIESMKQLPLRLLIAGEGDLSSSLRQRVVAQGLEDKVVFLGMLSPEELEILTPKAFLGYNLLENLGKSYYYSLSNKFFDYIHACVPGLSNSFPEYESINSKYDVDYLTNLSVAEIVLSVEKALKDPVRYEEIRLNCKTAREILNWQTEEKKLIQIYNDIR